MSVQRSPARGARSRLAVGVAAVTIVVVLVRSVLGVGASRSSLCSLRSWSVPLARADGDPASDYLLTRSTFVPPDLGISAADAARLSTTVALAQARGYPIRVALIGSAYDLGSVSLARPQAEAVRALPRPGADARLPRPAAGRDAERLRRRAGRQGAARLRSASSTACPRPARAGHSSSRPGSTACGRSPRRRACASRRRGRRPGGRRVERARLGPRRRWRRGGRCVLGRGGLVVAPPPPGE